MGASRKPKQVEVKLNLFTKMIDLNNKAEQQVAADNIQKKPRRIVTMKSGNNQAMVNRTESGYTWNRCADYNPARRCGRE